MHVHYVVIHKFVANYIFLSFNTRLGNVRKSTDKDICVLLLTRAVQQLKINISIRCDKIIVINDIILIMFVNIMFYTFTKQSAKKCPSS